MKLTTNKNGERVLYLDRDDVEGLPRLAGATRRYLLGGRDSHVERLVELSNGGRLTFRSANAVGKAGVARVAELLGARRFQPGENMTTRQLPPDRLERALRRARARAAVRQLCGPSPIVRAAFRLDLDPSRSAHEH